MFDDLDTLREGWDFEAKLAVGADGKGAIPESFWETYSAMANTSDAQMALAMAAQQGSVTHEQLHLVASSHPRDLTLMLQDLIRRGMLERDRPGKGCSYHLPAASTRHRTQKGLPLKGKKSAGDSEQSGPSSEQDVVAGEVAGEVTGEVTGEVARMLPMVSGEMTRVEIQRLLGLRHEDHFREAYLGPALQSGWLEMTRPDKPTSRFQRYRLTHKAKAWLASQQQVERP